MAERFYWFLLAVLGAWRITHLLASEDGPWNLLARLRRALDGGVWANLLDCFYCLSVWISAPFAAWVGSSFKERFLLWLAISAGAILLERATTRPECQAPAQYFEHRLEHQGDKVDVMLRKE
jgi:hypothetical protein